jgi:hypothetical protein
MKSKWTMVAVAAAATLAFSAADASAQVRLSLAAGPSFPGGEHADEHSLENGFHVKLAGELAPTQLPFGIRLDGTFNRFKEDDDNVDVLAGTANALFNLPGAGFAPYFLAGAGVYSIADHGERETKFGLNAGVGARFAVGGLGLYLEGRLHEVLGMDDSFRVIPVSIGIRF